MCCEPVTLERMPFHPSDRATTRHLDLDPVPGSVSLARSFVRSCVADLDDDSREVALLLTSELVTNAILHAGTPVHLGVVVDEDRACVCVGDRAQQTPELVPLARSVDRLGGRGLALVADLAESWGAATYAGGKTVWFALTSTSAHRPVSLG